MPKSVEVLTNSQIMAENRIGDALGWMRNYAKAHPDWNPTLDQISKISKRFRITEGCVLRLYDRLSADLEIEAKVKDVIDHVVTQHYFPFD